MSMIAHFRLVTPDVVEAIRSYSEDEMAEFLFPDDEELDTTEEIDKAWDAIGHLLGLATGGVITTVLNGAEVGEDLGYGPARFMTSDELCTIAAVVGDIDVVALLQHYDATAMNDAEVYPESWDDSKEMRNYLGDMFEIYKRMVLQGARDGHLMLLWLA